MVKIFSVFVVFFVCISGPVGADDGGAFLEITDEALRHMQKQNNTMPNH